MLDANSLECFTVVRTYIRCGNVSLFQFQLQNLEENKNKAKVI